jgi:hypothetical protein
MHISHIDLSYFFNDLVYIVELYFDIISKYRNINSMYINKDKYIDKDLLLIDISNHNSYIIIRK